MIVLTENTSLEVILAAAPTTQLPIYASFSDYSDDSETGKFLPDEKRTLTFGANAVEAVSRPAAGLKRMIDTITIRNSDASSATITVRIRDWSKVGQELEYMILVSEAIATTKTLQYSHSRGWS